MVRLRDVELPHLWFRRQPAGYALRQAHAAAGAGEDDVGTLLLRDAGGGEGQRVVRQHAGDEDAFAVEQSHITSDRVGNADVTALRSAVVRIGILGGTGPAGSALAARLASVGFDIVLGSRSTERASATTEELLSRWSGRKLKIEPADNTGAAAAD